MDGSTSRTDILGQLRSGASEPLDRLVPIVYAELRAIAHRQLSMRGRGGTLATTALVHEAYIKLARVVEYRFFGGLTEQEIAEAMGVTRRTVQRDWIKARALLHRELAP